MENLKDYKLIESKNKEDLERSVNYFIKDGYTPIGGVTIIKHSFVPTEPQVLLYYQAMIR